jgi:hypothetical protein
MPKKPTFDAATAFPRIAHCIRKTGAERYVTHGDLVEKLMDDTLVQKSATDPNEAWHVAEKMVGVFSAYFTKGYTKYSMDQYRNEFSLSELVGSGLIGLGRNKSNRSQQKTPPPTWAIEPMGAKRRARQGGVFSCYAE